MKLEAILSNIERGKQFEAVSDDGAIYIKIEDYVPFVCFAIHNGHNLRESLEKKCLLSEKERLYEEDPHTLDFISSMPIVISSGDSRYEYDLNRNPLECIYDTAWGRKVWSGDLTKEEFEESHRKYDNFYKLVFAIIKCLETRFKSVLVFDIHSYNYKRVNRDTPLFNIGTENVDALGFARYIDSWKKELQKIKLQDIPVTVAENDIFYGRGYLLEYITMHFRNTLVLATEIKKVYCNEVSGEMYPLLIEQLSRKLKRAFVNTAANFTRKQTNHRLTKDNYLLSSEIDKSLLSIDRQLFDIAKHFEILSYVNPVNIEQAKREFFKSKYSKTPEFHYKQLVINPFEFKRKLYNLPVENINDISLRLLYQDVIDAYADKVEMLASIGSERFLYNSLRYFGEPGETDIKNAEYILHCSSDNDGDETLTLSANQVAAHFYKVVKEYGFDCKIEVSNKIISKVLVLNARKTIKIRKDARFSEKSLKALSEHEIGVHMLTTVNSRIQALNILRLGTPLNTHTQEGLAILSEYLSGNLSIIRLQVLAFRVLTIKKLLQGADFKETFHFLMDSGKLDEHQAFYMTARVYRGGGFTKDFLYLKGFKDILNLHNNNTDVSNLLIGKTSVKYLSVINEMAERRIFYPPKYFTRSYAHPTEKDPIIEYLLKGLK